MEREKLQKILIIEDNDDIQKIAQMSLEMVGGFTTEVSSSGAEGLTKAESFNPHLVLLDMMMPLMNGSETFQKFKENSKLRNIPIVFITAKVQPNEVVEYNRLGALGVVTKPFDPMTLPESVLQLWDKL